MHHLKVSSDKILEALRRFGTNSSGGFLDQQSREYLVRNVGLTTSLEDLRNTVVDTPWRTLNSAAPDRIG